MANGYPKYGGTNGVAVLDIGQSGGTRHPAIAQWAGKSDPQADRVRKVPHGVAQQGVFFEANLGPGVGQVSWDGTLITNTRATMRTIFAELNAYLHGYVRSTVTGMMQPTATAQIVATQLWDWDETLISRRARLANWRRVGGIHCTPDGNYMTELSIEFELLG